MAKTKRKTQVSAFVGEELGEWLREHAFSNRKSQGDVIRDALRIYQIGQGKGRLITGQMTHNDNKYQVEIEVWLRNEIFRFNIIIYPTDGQLIPFLALLSEEEVEDHISENKSLAHLGKIAFKVVEKHLPKLLKFGEGKAAWNLTYWFREFGDKK